MRRKVVRETRKYKRKFRALLDQEMDRDYWNMYERANREMAHQYSGFLVGPKNVDAVVRGAVVHASLRLMDDLRSDFQPVRGEERARAISDAKGRINDALRGRLRGDEVFKVPDVPDNYLFAKPEARKLIGSFVRNPPPGVFSRLSMAHPKDYQNAVVRDLGGGTVRVKASVRRGKRVKAHTRRRA